MGSSFLTKGNKSICVVKFEPSYLIYKLEKREKYGFQFYGIFHEFKLALNHGMPLSDHPYGLLGSCVDLSGRMIGYKRRKPVISSPGERITTLEHPIYSRTEEYNHKELQEILEGYSPKNEDLPYASISTSALAVGNAGDDLYLNTLFFMTEGYGLLTKISAVAGRALEDCCSPEYYYETYKVQLETNPLKQIQENDIISGATLIEGEVSSSPEITTPVKVRFKDNPEKLNKLIDKLFVTLRP